MRTATIIVGVFLIVIVAGAVSVRLAVERRIENAKPYITYTRAMFTAHFCDEYKASKGVWPSSLSDLRVFHPELNDWARDTWGVVGNGFGRDFIFVPYNESLGYGEIISYGRDGKPGGTGPDQDIMLRFPSTTYSNWNAKVGESIPKPAGF